MTLADRIQALRKAQGLSQEALAEKLSVSRQAVGKWELSQSQPDLERIVQMSALFNVSTDYLLTGQERAPAPQPAAKGQQFDGHIFVIIATALNVLGVLLACAVWYEEQQAGAFLAGGACIACGLCVFGVGMYCCQPATRFAAKAWFWRVNIWMLAFLPLAFVYNVLFTGIAAPYPLFVGPVLFYVGFWAIYFALCLFVTLRAVKAQRRNAPPRAPE